MSEWERVGRPVAIGSRKAEVFDNCDRLYGKENWRPVWDIAGTSATQKEALVLYEEAYDRYFEKHPDELTWIARNHENVYDNHPSNVNSGLDYAIQEFGGNHFQDIAIRRCMDKRGMHFEGKGLLEIRLNEPGVQWQPGNIPFHRPEIIPQPELRGWWKSGSLESWYRSARYLEVRGLGNLGIDLSKDLYFVTGNRGKMDSALKALGDFVSLEQLPLTISEEQERIEDVAIHKAKVAYAVLCRPVICDDSAFVIHSMNGYPGARVKRELDAKGVESFTALAKNGPLDAAFVMAVTYYDETLDKPLVWVSTVDGTLISEQRGDLQKRFIKSSLPAAFVVKGQTKTIAEMTREEYDEHATTDR